MTAVGYVTGAQRTDFPAVLAADVPTTTTTLANVTGLSLAIPGPGTFEFEFVLPYTGSVAVGSGIVLQLAATGAPPTSALLYVIEIQSTNGTFSSYTKSAFASTAPSSQQNIQTVGTPYMARIRGRLVATGSGTLQPQFAANAASTTTTVKAGAYAKLTTYGEGG